MKYSTMASDVQVPMCYPLWATNTRSYRQLEAGD